jgi:hypothetical protein
MTSATADDASGRIERRLASPLDPRTCGCLRPGAVESATFASNLLTPSP